MRRGVPLSHVDREPWLAALHAELVKRAGENVDVVLACSALKESYRERLGAGVEMRIAYLKGTYGEIAARLQGRTDHFAERGFWLGSLRTWRSRSGHSWRGLAMRRKLLRWFC